MNGGHYFNFQTRRTNLCRRKSLFIFSPFFYHETFLRGRITLNWYQTSKFLILIPNFDIALQLQSKFYFQIPNARTVSQVVKNLCLKFENHVVKIFLFVTEHISNRIVFQELKYLANRVVIRIFKTSRHGFLFNYVLVTIPICFEN